MSRLAEARSVGRCYVIGEAGSNHNGEWAVAERLVDAAADAGCDAVKFQAFRAERLYPRGAGTADYLGDREDIYDIVARMELPTAWLPRLHDRAAAAGIDFLASVFDEESASLVDPYVPAHKVASYELTHEPLVRRVAELGKPLIVSTGAATRDEIASALAAARAAGATDITLLQCTAAYPSPLEAVNVAAITDLRTTFGVDAGLSDHSLDPVIAPVLAIAFGATIIEKHFTLDRSLPGPDHRFALEPDDLRAMVRSIRDAEAARGSGRKEVDVREEELRAFARRSVFAVRDIAAGEEFGGGNVAVLRHGKRGQGLDPSRYVDVIGRRAARALAANAPLRDEDVEWTS